MSCQQSMTKWIRMFWGLQGRLLILSWSRTGFSVFIKNQEVARFPQVTKYLHHNMMDFPQILLALFFFFHNYNWYRCDFSKDKQHDKDGKRLWLSWSFNTFKVIIISDVQHRRNFQFLISTPTPWRAPHGRIPEIPLLLTSNQSFNKSQNKRKNFISKFLYWLKCNSWIPEQILIINKETDF